MGFKGDLISWVLLVELGLRAIRTIYARKDLRRAPIDIWLKSAFSWVHHTYATHLGHMRYTDYCGLYACAQQPTRRAGHTRILRAYVGASYIGDLVYFTFHTRASEQGARPSVRTLALYLGSPSA